MMLTDENILEVVKVLQGDEELVEMLAPNPPYYDERIRAEKKINSIVPTGFIENLKNMPAVGVRAGVTQKAGHNLVNAFILVRCYNNMDKTYVDINRVLSRAQYLLENKKFNLTGMTTIDTKYQGISEELVDEGYNLRFRELQVVISII